MKRLNKIRSRDFEPVVVTSRKIQLIIDALEGCDEIKLVADDVEYESVSEFVQHNSTPPEWVQIKSSKPYVTLELFSHATRLSVGSSDVEASGYFARVSELVESCERRPRVLYRYWPMILFSWLLAFPIMSATSLQMTKIATTAALLVLYACWLARIVYIHVKRHSIVLPLKDDEIDSFWRRNSDTLKVALIAALFGALIGAVITKAIERAWQGHTAGPKSTSSTSQKGPDPSGSSDK